LGFFWARKRIALFAEKFLEKFPGEQRALPIHGLAPIAPGPSIH
jgi:hypothetical protein